MRSSEVGLHDCCRQSLNCYRSLASNGAGEPRHSTSFARGVAQQHGPLSTKKQRVSPVESWKSPPPSSAQAPRRRHPLAQSHAVAIPSPRAASSLSLRCMLHRRRSLVKRLGVAVPRRASSLSWSLPACSLSTSTTSCTCMPSTHAYVELKLD